MIDVPSLHLIKILSQRTQLFIKLQNQLIKYSMNGIIYRRFTKKKLQPHQGKHICLFAGGLPYKFYAQEIFD